MYVYIQKGNVYTLEIEGIYECGEDRDKERIRREMQIAYTCTLREIESIYAYKYTESHVCVYGYARESMYV